MLNYIKAELWKVLHRRGVYVLLALLLLCTALFFMLYSYGGFSSLAKGISVTMVVGMLAAPLLVQLVDGGTADTLKNELSFGLRRGTVYWGKLCAALLLGLAFCLVLVGGSLAGGWLFLPRGEPEEALEGLAFWVWAQRRSLREAAYRLRALEDTGSTARVRLAVPNSAAEELLDEVNRLLELRQADRAAYQARERALRQQIANVSHDLRTPLTSILGYLQLLEDPGLTEGERREYLAVIAGRARTLQSLITSFYDLSRLEGGEYLLQREKVDLYASLSGLLAAFYNDFTDRGFDMEVELAEGLPQVWADAGAVLRIFTNLIRNALEHGEGRMEIRLYQEGGQVVSRFSNETHALTAEDVPHVFDRFFTSDKMRTGRNTGLGLAIVKALAGQMDCRAEAALEGDMFAITLRWPVERR